jgi:hypothetical protein
MIVLHEVVRDAVFAEHPLAVGFLEEAALVGEHRRGDDENTRQGGFLEGPLHSVGSQPWSDTSGWGWRRSARSLCLRT